MDQIIRCPNCQKIFFDIGENKCPFCGKDRYKYPNKSLSKYFNNTFKGLKKNE